MGEQMESLKKEMEESRTRSDKGESERVRQVGSSP